MEKKRFSVLLAISVLLFSFSTVFVFADSEDIESLIEQSFNEIQVKNYQKANSLIDKALEIDPNSIDALNNKAVILFHLGRIDQAESYVDKALEIDDSYPPSLYNKGIFLGSQGNYYDAIPYFMKTLELDSDHEFSNDTLIFAVEKSVKRKLIDGIMQLTVRNSDGTLVTHYQTKDIVLVDHEIFKFLIEKYFEKETIIQNSHKVEVLYHNLTFDVNYDKQYGSWWIVHPESGLKVVIAKTPTIHLKQGDTVIADYYIFSLG